LKINLRESTPEKESVFEELLEVKRQDILQIYLHFRSVLIVVALIPQTNEAEIPPAYVPELKSIN